MRISLIVLLAVFSNSPSFAQSTEIDSLRNQVNILTGTKKIDALSTLSLRLIVIDFSLASSPIEEALTLSTKLGYLEGLAEANVTKGILESVN